MKTLQKGFTLIELMIVVAIIGILAAVAIPAYQDYIVKAKLSKVQSTMDPIKLALGMYYQENGGFPGGNNDTTAHTVVAGEQQTTSDAYFLSLGLATYPAIPSEVKEMTVKTLAAAGTLPTTIEITLTPQNIKAGTCNTTITAPTGGAGIDTCPLVMTGIPGSTAISWSYTGSALGNIVANKYFK